MTVKKTVKKKVMNGNVWKSGNGFQIKKGGIKPPKNTKNNHLS